MNSGLETKDAGAGLSQSDTESEFDLILTTFTWRATLLGSLLGCIVAAGNIYLGLKIGFGTNASLFSSIAAFGILKAAEKAGGAPLGMRENCAAQTAASAAGSMYGMFISAVPAMFQLGLLPRLEESLPTLLIWTLAGSFYALFFAVPLRSYFIIQQHLVYPTPTAVAHTIRALHSSTRKTSRTRARWIFGSFCVSFIHKFVSFFVPFLSKTHVIYGVGVVTGSDLLKKVDRFYGWRLEATGALLGVGVMLGINVSLSMFGGSVLLWGILSPVLMREGVVSAKSPFGFPQNSLSVQGWGLWVGIVIVLCSSISELLSQPRTLCRAVVSSVYSLAAYVLPLGRRGVDDASEPTENLIPSWLWMSGLFVSGSSVLILMHVSFGLPLGAGLLAVVLGLLFSLVGCQCAATTDINPTGVLAKGSQLVFSALPSTSGSAAQMGSLCAGGLTQSCAMQAVDMVGDLKAGHLLNASPKGLVYSQMVGSLLGAFTSVAVFYLFAKAYPCILQEAGQGCEFPAPSAAAWAGVTRALTSDMNAFIPPSCRIACLVFGLATILTAVLRKTFLKNHAHLLPSWNAIGIGFFIPSPLFTFVFLMGAVFGWMFRRSHPHKWKLVGIVLASGLIAGEGISGVAIAFLSLAGINQQHVATGFACPEFSVAKC